VYSSGILAGLRPKVTLSKLLIYELFGVELLNRVWDVPDRLAFHRFESAGWLAHKRAIQSSGVEPRGGVTNDFKKAVSAEVPARASATVANSSRNVAWIVFI
jgi:hypothetical protein